MTSDKKNMKQEPEIKWVIKRSRLPERGNWRGTEYVSAIMTEGCVATTADIERAKHFSREQAERVLERITAYYQPAPIFRLQEYSNTPDTKPSEEGDRK